LHSGEHLAFEQQLGLPVFLAYMDEHIFEKLPLEEAKAWPLRFIEAVPVGVDLELVFPRFMHWLLSDPDGVRQYADARTVPIMDTIVAMYARRIEGIPFDVAAAGAAWDAAGAAARTAARTAAGAAVDAAGAAVDAAWAAAGAAGGDAAGAAWAAARAAAGAAGDAAGAAAIRRQADYLIALLQGYESQPLADLPPCTEQLHALHFAVKG